MTASMRETEAFTQGVGAVDNYQLPKLKELIPLSQ
jgi:hypothetical protein